MTRSSKKKTSTSLHITRPYAQQARTIRFHRNPNNRIGSSTAHSTVTAISSGLTVEQPLSDQLGFVDHLDIECDAGLPDAEDLVDEEPQAKKRKRRTRTNIMEEWRDHRDTYLQEMLRHDGREGLQATTCAHCGDVGDFLCNDCAYRLHYCQKCMIDRHRLMPFHRIQVHLILLHADFYLNFI